MPISTLRGYDLTAEPGEVGARARGAAALAARAGSMRRR